MADVWHNGLLALRLLAQNHALGGLVLRARAGPVREAFLQAAEERLGPITKLHPAMTDETLLGGIDLAATLASGEVVLKQGLLQANSRILLAMAERASPAFTARLTRHLDQYGGPMILCDEGATLEEFAPDALSDRLAFHVDLTDVSLSDISRRPAGHADKNNTDQIVDPSTQIVEIAQHFGIDSLRAPSFALVAAKAHAALSGRDTVVSGDIGAACALVYAHRATLIPDSPPPPSQKSESDIGQTQQSQDRLPDDLVLEAVKAMLPDDLLDRVAAAKARGGKGSGSGALQRGNRRGRPLPARAGRRDNARIDLMATLRTAVPWQTIRRRDTGTDRLHVRASDIRNRQFAAKTDRLLIFAVDASGSAALARLAEAKGAVELLLAQAYSRRDHVALISFRGDAAQTLLPPTRSIVQTKRRLAGLPGGGGTPLAAGLDAALLQALTARRKGITPTICLLTDGRANIARDGTANRQQAAADATQSAAQIRAAGIEALVIDTGHRPAEALRTLAQTLSAPYLPLPRANAERLSRAVQTALAD